MVIIRLFPRGESEISLSKQRICSLKICDRDRSSLYRIKQYGSGYQEITQSQIFPNLDLKLMAQYIRPDREPEMVRAWRKFINSSK